MILKQVACPGSEAGSAVKGPCGLALAASQPSGQHDTGPGYSMCRRRRVCTSFRPEPFTILEELLRMARVATMRAAAAGCKLM